jgi:uncharacterized protein
VNALLHIGAVAIGIYLALCVLLYLFQDRLLYIPPAQQERPGGRVLRLPSGEATLRIWQLHTHARDALIYFGGNAERVAANLPDFDKTFPDRAIYLVNYRSYDGSTGRPSEAALIGDAELIYDWVANRHRHVAVMGRSLGSGIAAALSSTRPVERLVLVTPYDTIANVAADHFWWLPVRWLINDDYDSLPRVAKVQAPALVVIAEHDEVISRARSNALLAAIPASYRHSIVIEDATHNDLDAFVEYLRSVEEFMTMDAGDALVRFRK